MTSCFFTGGETGQERQLAICCLLLSQSHCTRLKLSLSECPSEFACCPSPLTSSRPERHTFCVLSGRELTDYVASWPSLGHSRPGRQTLLSSDLLPNEKGKGKVAAKCRLQLLPIILACPGTQTTHLSSPRQRLMAKSIPEHSLNHRIAIHLVMVVVPMPMLMPFGRTPRLLL